MVTAGAGAGLLAAAAPDARRGPALHLRDMAGRTVDLPGPPRRIVMIPPHLPRFTTVAAGADTLVGTSLVARSQVGDTVLARIYPRTAVLPVVGATPWDVDAERILALKPDAVIAWRRDNLPPLPGLIEIRSDPLAQEPSVRAMWDLFGVITGDGARAANLMRAGDAAVGAVRARLRSATGAAPRVASLYGGAGLGTIGGRLHYLEDLIETAGGRNPAASSGQPVALTLEELAALDPDVILLTFSYKRQPTDIYADPAWRILRAVRTRRVYRVPAFPDAAGPIDRPLALTWLAEVVHPGVLATDLRRQVAETYRRTFNYALSPAELDQLLAKAPNAASASFAR